MLLQVTAYPVMDGVAVLVNSAELADGKRNWTVLVQEVVRPAQELEGAWDIAWLVAGLIMDRAAERSPDRARPA